MLKICLQVYCKNRQQNYIIFEVDGKTHLITKAYFLHNTKIFLSAAGENNQKKRKEKKRKETGVTMGDA